MSKRFVVTAAAAAALTGAAALAQTAQPTVPEIGRAHV